MAERLVFLGGSNLSRAFPMVVQLARHVFEGPLSIHVAKGFGRSYGMEAGCLGKKFPGIFFSEIWTALEQENASSTRAWITDIGNDLGYEASVESILRWVSGCVDRLESIGAKTILCDLPLATLCRLNERHFRLARTVFFPRCRLTCEELLSRAACLNEGLHALAESRKTSIFSVPNEFYGIDPLHPRRKYFRNLWTDLFRQSGIAVDDSARARSGWLLSCYLRLLRPECWTHFSISRHASQPNGRLLDGSTVSLH